MSRRWNGANARDEAIEAIGGHRERVAAADDHVTDRMRRDVRERGLELPDGAGPPPSPTMRERAEWQ